jgi:hypothetical protein
MLGPRRESCNSSDRAFDWLVEYQINGLSQNKISKKYEAKREQIKRTIDELAQLLIGAEWEMWLKPHPKGGRPRKDQPGP